MEITDTSQQFISQTFSNSKISNIEFLPEGLTSKVFLISIENPKLEIILKEFAIKTSRDIEKDLGIQKLLETKGLKVAKVFGSSFESNPGILLLEKLPGKAGSDLFKVSNSKDREKIMFSAGANLRKIHQIYKTEEIPTIWQISKVTIKTADDWVNWTKLRVEKYLKFSAENLNPDTCRKITETFKFLEEDLTQNAPVIVPLHWDYHLGNLLFNDNLEVVATLDFATAMPGDPLADLGQALYWQIIKFGNREHFEDILKGYSTDFNDRDLQLIEAYYLLHLLAVSRNTWQLEDLEWLKEKHLDMLSNYRFSS